jgi:hypothetical protein
MNRLQQLHVVIIAASLSASLPAEAAEARPAESNLSPENTVIRIDGDLSDSVWQQASALRDISFPWSERPAPTTIFRAAADTERLYFAFEAIDDDVVVEKNFSAESVLDREDRVESFRPRPRPERYFCLEIDPVGRVHDYAASHYRKFDNSWACAGLQVAGKSVRAVTRRGVNSPADPHRTRGQPVAAGASLRVGIFRAEFRREARGDGNDNWLSWVKPTTDKPDFHVPSAFADWRLPAWAPASAFQTRGVVLVPDDLSLLDWPERAARAGLTTIGLHHSSSPKVVADFIESVAGQEFLAKCARLGLQVEYELHAMRELLPQALFATEPALFRMMNRVSARTQISCPFRRFGDRGHQRAASRAPTQTHDRPLLFLGRRRPALVPLSAVPRLLRIGSGAAPGKPSRA